MANKTIVQLTSKPTLTTADLIPVGDASTAILYKRTLGDLISGLGIVIASGTANYVPKFTSTNVLGNSQIYEYNNNIGIGLTNPSSKFEIVSPAGVYNTSVSLQSDIGNGITITANTTGTNSRVALFLRASDRIGAAISSARENPASNWNTYLAFYTNNVTGGNVLNIQEKARFTANGYFGIGTTTPKGKLTVANGRAYFGGGNESFAIGVSYTPSHQDAEQNFYIGASNSTTPDLIFSNISGTERMRITSNGNIGIGVTSPAYKLDVAGDVNINGVFRINGTPISSGGGGTGTITGAGTTTYIPKWTSSSALGDSPISVDGSNNVTIGSNTVYTGKFNVLVGNTGGDAYMSFTSIAPYGFSWGVLKTTNGAGAYKTQVYDAGDHNWYIGGSGKMYLSSAGDLYINQSSISGTYKLDVNGAIRSTVDVIITSDKRVKDNIINVTDALNKVDAMQGVYYTRKDLTNNKQYIGFLAQDLEGTLPQVVNQDSLGNYGVSYGNITALHNEAIKELNKEIKHLKSIINGFTY